MLNIFIFLFGLVIGSFLNVLIDRLPKEESIRGRSYCPRCRAILKWYDLIPVLSFILLYGKCRYCKQKISLQYPIVEIITGLLFLLIFSSTLLGASNFQFLNAVYYLFIISCLIVIFVSDLKYYIIPDQIIYSAIAITFFSNIFILNSKFQILNSILSAILAGGFFLLLVIISRGKWMGMGDVKLAFLMGLILGWPKILIALFLAFFSGALIGSALIIFKKKTWKSEIPFGTFLAAGTLLILFFGDSFLAFFLNYF